MAESSATSTSGPNSGVPESVDVRAEEPAAVPEADAMQKGACGENASVDPYAYLQRKSFTSEIYKIVITNIKKFPGYGKVKSMVREACGFDPKKIRSNESFRGKLKIFVTFCSKVEQEKAIQTLNGMAWKDTVLEVKSAPPSPDPLLLKRKKDASREPAAKRPKIEEEEEDTRTPSERLNAAVTPYYGKPYEEQLKLKQDANKAELRNIALLFVKHNNVPSWLKEQCDANDNMACPLETILPSPVTLDYRNKCEFSIGRGLDHEVTVGFRVGRYMNNQITNIAATDCVHLHASAKAVSTAVQTYIRNSDKEAYDEVSHSGYWQQCTVRTSAGGDCLVMFQLHPQDMGQNEFDAEKAKLEEFFLRGEGASCPVTSFFLQIDGQRYPNLKVASGLHHVFGKKHIEHRVLDLTFRVSPLAFFQVNIPATELLYSKVREWCEVGEQTTLLDICCGTGTIGLTMAKSVKKVIGIEMVEQAIDDAKHNAEVNGIENVEYVCGKAEHVLSEITGQFSHGAQLIGVVDPPRSGLMPSVVDAIRRCAPLKRLIYVACNIKASKQNILHLCKPHSKRYPQQGFRLVKAVPVDLFPQTPHCELIMLLERVPSPRGRTTPSMASTVSSTADQ